MSDFQFRLNALAGKPSFTKWHRGVEKEALRVTSRGELASTPHPPSLGSPLTHPKITTDFSEAQLEIITGVHDSTTDCLDELDNLHRFAYGQIGSEYLWPASMPCFVGSDRDVPIAYYGESNQAKIKSIYRMGLANRYGRRMQTISGIHYNFSLSDEFWGAFAEVCDDEDGIEFRNSHYMNLIRNFRRLAWLPIYLFGASPAVCRSFAPRSIGHLQDFDEGSYFLPDATSLRMGPLGYQSTAQSARFVSFNSLDDYIRTLVPLLTEEHPDYVKYGVEREGTYEQLNTALLQIEAEFYGTIRPKRKGGAGERPIEALRRRGVEYVEVRCLDLDPFHPVGIALDTMDFLDLFLVFCLLSDSPQDDAGTAQTNVRNQETVVERGREPGLLLEDGENERTLAVWAGEVLREVAALGVLVEGSIESGEHSPDYGRIVNDQIAKVENRKNTPSQRVLDSMRGKNTSYSSWGLSQARVHQDHYKSHPVESVLAAELEALAQWSLAQQKMIESEDDAPFETYLAHYLQLDL